MTQDQSSVDAWDKEGQQYPEAFDNRFEGTHGRRWNALEVNELRFDDLASRSHCLEVGCGTGRFISDLADRGHNAYGIDPSDGMIAIAKQKTANKRQVHLQQGEGNKLPYENNFFDLVFAIRVTRHTLSRQYCLTMIDEIVRVTKPGGRIVIEFSNRLRPRRRAAETTFSIGELQSIYAGRRDVNITGKSGIMILSQGLYYRVPASLLPFWSGIDTFLSKLLPSLASYFYLTFKKVQ